MFSDPVTIGAAFSGGLISFFSPCVLVLVPAFLAYISGASLNKNTSRWQIFISTLIFSLGFTLVFVLLGASLGWLSESLQNFDVWLEKIGGAVIIFFGLVIWGVIKIPWFSAEHKVNLKIKSRSNFFRLLGAFILGIIFAIGWTPLLAQFWQRYWCWLAIADQFYRELGYCLFIQLD